MDEFGVLTERFGLKPQGKSAPMAASKANTFQSRNSSFDSGFLDVSSQNNTKPGGYGDYFGSFNQSTDHSGNSASSSSSFDHDSIFFGSKISDSIYDDVFGGIPGLKSSVTAKTENPVRSVDDLFGDFGGNVAKTTIPKRNGLESAANNAAPFDELIPGFGNGNSRINSYNQCSLVRMWLGTSFIDRYDHFRIRFNKRVPVSNRDILQRRFSISLRKHGTSSAKRNFRHILDDRCLQTPFHLQGMNILNSGL